MRTPDVAFKSARGYNRAWQPAYAHYEPVSHGLTAVAKTPVSQIHWRLRACWQVCGLATAALLSACQGTPETPPRPPLAVQSQEAEVALFSNAVDTVSTLEALGEVQLAAQAGGRIQTLLVRQGDQVRQKDP